MLIRTVLLCLVLTCGVASHGQKSAYPAIDSVLSYLHDNQAFNGRVTLRKGKEIIYSGSYEYKSKGTNRYKIGSVTKVFTAQLVYQSIEAGLLSLETPLSDYYPLIKHSGEIKIRHMLSHTSGIYDITRMEGYFEHRDLAYTHEQLVNVIVEHEPAFLPGKDCEYSNSNYILLGFILEKVNAKTYDVLIRERYNDALSLKNTYCEVTGQNFPDREDSWICDGENWSADVNSDPSVPGAAGAIVSTTEDLSMMMYDLFNKRIIADNSLDTMKKVVYRKYGHGLIRAPFFDKEGWGHTGRIDEFRSFVGYFPDDSLSLAVTTNGMNGSLNEILIAVLSGYYARPYKAPVFEHTTITEPATSAFYGKYKVRVFRFFKVATIEITQAGFNHLYMNDISAPSQKSLMSRKSAYVFHDSNVGADLTFRANKKGRVKGITMKQGKFTIRCKKVRS